MPTLQVRHLPEHIYQKIVERAKAKRRSIAQETVMLLQKALQMEERTKELRCQLIYRLLQDPFTQGDIPDPVLLVREDRKR
jgi:plasmid stability protein